MQSDELNVTLTSLVDRFGFSSVLRTLADIQSPKDVPSASRPGVRMQPSPRAKLSAVAYVNRMTLPRDKAEALANAAHRFDDKLFLPTVADIREFSRVHGLKASKSTSRSNAIPRLFTFLAMIDTSKFAEMLEDSQFCGPARLAPIADAIRGYPHPDGRSASGKESVPDTRLPSPRRHETHVPEHAQPLTADSKEINTPDG